MKDIQWFIHQTQWTGCKHPVKSVTAEDKWSGSEAGQKLNDVSPQAFTMCPRAVEHYAALG